MVILPYKLGSRSAKALAQALNIRRVRHDGNFRNNYRHTVLNWGSSTPSQSFQTYRILNEYESVGLAANKKLSFQRFQEHSVNVPEFYTKRDDIPADYFESGKVMVCRTVLSGHSGAGIVLARSSEELVDAPLYVEYIKKQDEYRYHVFNGKVIDIQQKKKRREVENEEVNYQIRNASTGWVYCRSDINPDDSLSSLALSAVECLGLDFGAVDIIWNNKREEGYVLEVNTACGLEGTTLDSYVNAIREIA